MNSDFVLFYCLDCYLYTSGLCSLTEPFSSYPFHPNFSPASDEDISRLSSGGDF